MKSKKILNFILISCLPFACCACSGTESAKSADSELSPADLSEKAMNNFVKKLEAGNYVVDTENYLVTTAVSPEQVYFTYSGDSTAEGFGFVTLKGETFEGTLDEASLSDVKYVSADTALNTLGELLPNSWITLSEGNMFELFYNNIDNPLEFTSNDGNVKMTLISLGGYGQNALSHMEEVHMVLDAEDPSSVRFTAVLEDDPVARIDYEDLDLTLQFGAAKGDSRIEKWLGSPVYPATRTSWTQDDIYMLDNVFLRDYGTESVPFPSFASYAMNFDDQAYDEFTGIRVTDAHGTEKNLEDYKADLLAKGFEEASWTDEDGSTVTVYRRLLRDDYRAYAQLYPYYEDGFVLEGRLYHDNPVYEGLSEISGVIAEHGFEPLAETDLFSGWNATDSAASRSESWVYFFDYDLYMPVLLSYTDFDGAKAYLQEYADRLLKNGFTEAFVPGEDNGMAESPNGFVSFRYTFNGDNTVTLEFKNEKSYTAEKARELIKEHGLPEADLHGDIGSRDLTRYRYNLGAAKGLFLTVYQPFDSREEAEKFLDAYVSELDENGYLMIDPQKVGSQKPYCYWNAELSKYVAFDLVAEEKSTSVNFEFVSIEPEEESVMLSAIRY